MKKIDMTAFRKDCEKINRRLHDRPGKTETMRIYHKLFRPSVATRMYRRKKIHFCTECGCEVQWLGQKRCPQCGTHWNNGKVEDYNNRSYTTEYSDAVIFQAVGDVQLTRYYRVERCVHYGKPVSIYAWEIMRFFYAPSGERVMYQRAVQGFSSCWDSFSRWGALYHRQERTPQSSSYGAINRANLSVCYWGVRSLTKQWSYKNVLKVLDNFHGDTSAIRLIAYPYGETMLKCGQERLFRYLTSVGQRLPKRAENAANLCIRHKYTIENPSMWLDTLYMLDRFGYDTHNPKFVCPDNLGKLHDTLLKRKKRIEEARAAKIREVWERRREEERQRWDAEYARREAEKAKRAAELVNNWSKHFGKMLSIELTGTNLQIKPLQSIDEFKEEGEHMHHCVYQLGYYDYYKRPATLILSAKDSAGKRLATIEYDMRTNEVIQCRAACNAIPPRKAEIIQLIADHKQIFQKCEKTVRDVSQSA